MTRLAAAMQVHQISSLLTLNDKDFRKFTFVTVIDPRTV